MSLITAVSLHNVALALSECNHRLHSKSTLICSTFSNFDTMQYWRRTEVPRWY